MFKTVLIVLAVLIAGVLVLAATRPDTFRVERSTRIHAPPDRVFALINDFHRWQAWSPYEKKDPGMKRAFSGNPNGAGAAYAWDGDRNIGAGQMRITESVPTSRVALSLEFARPFKGHNQVEFTLQPKGGATEVTWAMHGPSPYIAKVMGLVFDMDEMIGEDFENGLADLKAVAEH
ncbi:SRPBCC family protein [Lysobacter niastensis]|uniref:SRPBCC family protein n=1 Tax=Lysobacter niastensis TaxID=380629 RepID=A0ABS0B6H9_9GAMM|nr:SRPBCC family protein [Lysobacter niastensis]MBF6024626.1 SRPBCC family protein [Lysobacter niastensis]